jgi:hypothetical protein
MIVTPLTPVLPADSFATFFDIQSVVTPTIYIHIVTLINRRTEAEATLTIETTSDRYVEVSREIAHQKAIRKLFGYEVFEVLDQNSPF